MSSECEWRDDEKWSPKSFPTTLGVTFEVDNWPAAKPKPAFAYLAPPGAYWLDGVKPRPLEPSGDASFEALAVRFAWSLCLREWDDTLMAWLSNTL